jgi:hypothetical protein
VDGRKDQTLMKRRRGVRSEVSQSNYGRGYGSERSALRTVQPANAAKGKRRHGGSYCSQPIRRANCFLNLWGWRLQIICYAKISGSIPEIVETTHMRYLSTFATS